VWIILHHHHHHHHIGSGGIGSGPGSSGSSTAVFSGQSALMEIEKLLLKHEVRWYSNLIT